MNLQVKLRFVDDVHPKGFDTTKANRQVQKVSLSNISWSGCFEQQVFYIANPVFLSLEKTFNALSHRFSSLRQTRPGI